MLSLLVNRHQGIMRELKMVVGKYEVDNKSLYKAEELVH